MSTTENNKYASGLVFLGMRNLDIVGLSSLVSRVFEVNNRRVSQVRIQSENQATISGDGHLVQLMSEAVATRPEGGNGIQDTDPDAVQPAQEESMIEGALMSLFISIESTGEAHEDNPSIIMAFLAGITEYLSRETQADMIQWLDPNMVLDAQDFSMAMSPQLPLPDTQPEGANDPATRVNLDPVASPQFVPEAPVQARRVHPAERRFPDVDTITDILRSSMSAFEAGAERGSDAFQAHFEATDKSLREVFRLNPEDETTPNAARATTAIRLATWAISLSVAMFALPLAVFLIILNLFRGENLRLAGQAMGLTGLMIPLNASGAFADILTTIAG